VTMDVKRPGDLVYLLGRTEDELGGSEYYAQLGHLGANVPKVDAAVALQRYRTVNLAQQQGLLASCHDLSDGGLAVALAESAFAGGFGMDVDLSLVDAAPELGPDKRLFSESQSRLLITVTPQHQSAIEELFRGQSCALIGKVVETPELKVCDGAGRAVIQSQLHCLKNAWQATLKEM
jgi:phosphoribosylformylglycinamidine synthase subunit PurSL